MHHIVAHRQLGKALDLLALVGGLLAFALFLLLAEHIPFGDDRKLDLRIGKAPVQIAKGNQDLPRLHLPALIVRAEGAQIVLPQILRQTAGTGTGTG